MKLSERYFQSLFPKTILLVLLFMANQVFPTTTPARPSVSDSALAIKLYTLALESTRNGIFDSVEVWLNEALPIFKKEGDWKYQTESYYLLSGLNYRTGQAGQAAQYLDTASYLLSAHTDSSNFLYAPYYHHRATVFYVMGNYPEAKKLFLQAIEAYKSYPDEQSQKVINSYNNLGLTFVNLSDYENAVAYLQKCLDLNIKYKSDNNYLIGRSHNNLGMAYYRKGGSESERFDYDYFGKESFRKAEIHYQAALENYLQVLSPPNIALGQCYLNLATVASAKNDLPACIEYNKQALINFGEGSNTPFPHIADVYYNTGIAFKAAGQMDSAYHYVSKAINSGTLFYGKKHRYLSDYYNYRGRVCMEIDNYDEALSDFQQALIITCINFDDTSFLSNPKISNILLKEEAMRCFAWKASALVDKYKHSQNTNDLKMAVENYYHFNDLVKIILSEFNTEEAKLSFMQSVQENYGYIMNLCYQLYAISPNKKYLEDALFFSENEKSATLSAYIDQSVAREIAGISPEEIENEKNAQDKRLKFESQYKNLRADNTSDSTMLDAVADSLLEARYQCELLASQINQKNKKYALQNLTQQPIKIREVQSLLATKNAAAVEYFLLDTAVYIIAVDKDDYIFHRENIDSTFYTQLSDYRKSISDYHFISSNPQEAYQSYTHLALELYNLLFPEAIRPLVEQNQKIIIIPGSELNYLSFDGLLTTAAHNRPYKDLDYLANDYIISYANAIRYISLGEEDKNPNRNYAGFAPEYDQVVLASHMEPEEYAIFRDDPGLLREHTDEVKHAGEVLGGDIYIGNQASEGIFKKSAGDYQILHFAMHAQINDNNPLSSKFLFSQLENDAHEDNFLNTYEIYNLDLNARLVVLSACNTASGILRKGEGVMSLSRAFMFSGVSSIVSSLWLAEDHASNKIMSGFFNGVSQGLPVDEALHLSRQEYLKTSDPVFAHPYYWANFILTGNNDPVKQISGFPFKNVIFITLFALLFIGVLFFIIRKILVSR